MQDNDYNGLSLSTIRVGHTLTGDKQPRMKKQRLDEPNSPLSLRDGTRLFMIRRAESPYMTPPSTFIEPLPPLVINSYSAVLKNVQKFRVTIVGTIHDLGEVEPSGSGQLKRQFKLADKQGMWIHCVAHGKHAESEHLKDMHRILAYFGTGRPPLGENPRMVWFFKDSFIVPLNSDNAVPLQQEVV